MITRVVGVDMTPSTGQVELEFDTDLHTGVNAQFFAGEPHVHLTTGHASLQVRLVLDDLLNRSKVLWVAFMADRPRIVRIGLVANDPNILRLIQQTVSVINALREATFQSLLDSNEVIAEHARLVESIAWTRACVAIQRKLGNELRDAFNATTVQR